MPSGEREAMPILVYDGACGFCKAAVAWLARRLERRTRLLPWQEIEPSALGLAEADLRRTAWWIECSGERFHSERAVARALMACGGGWRRLGLLLLAPGVRTAAALGYRGIARIRHRLPGGRTAEEAGGSRVAGFVEVTTHRSVGGR